MPVARSTVERLMREEGLRGISRAKGPRTTRPAAETDGPADLVERRFTADAPNRPAARRAPVAGGPAPSTLRPTRAGTSSNAASTDSRPGEESPCAPTRQPGTTSPRSPSPHHSHGSTPASATHLTADAAAGA
ncbi:hypothetical protein [Sinomonas cyclohexanicum]|uniref:hypothetical protein n=1 Tax=Sinomonas cyclohexanicum TaxID=322009 RepID=UPI0035304BE7